MKLTSHRIFLVLFTCATSIVTAVAADRVALVIGNDAYQHARPLNAAVSDATAVASTLQKLGFETISASNAGLEQMIEAMDTLKTKAAGAQAVLVYYAGHGIEAQGANYLVPIDAKLEKEVQLQTQAVNLNSVLDKLTALNVPARMVILDCCRDNPLEGRSWLATRSAGGGGLGELPVQALPAATLVVYAASPGKPALDRVNDTDAHSPFTQALLDTLPEPGVHSFEVFGRVEESVLTRTEGRQSPRVFYNGSTLPFRNFRFSGQPTTASTTPVMTVIQTPPVQMIAASPDSMPPTTVSLTASGVAPILPASGFFDLNALFIGSSYASYNTYSRSQILRKAQEKLKAGGFYTSTADGAPGPGTQRGIIAWQQTRSLPVTGLLDARTLASLELTNIAPMIEPARSSKPSGVTAKSSGASKSTPSRSGGRGDMSTEEFMQRARQLEGF
jgi:hypothetical protein